MESYSGEMSGSASEVEDYAESDAAQDEDLNDDDDDDTALEFKPVVFVGGGGGGGNGSEASVGAAPFVA